MPKKEMFTVLAVVTVLVGALVVWGIRDGQSSGAAVDGVQDAAIVYYFGQECPHCQRVSQFLEDNKIAEKVDFVKKEVWHDAANNREMEQRAKSVCGIDKNALGVPFLIGDGKCYVGEDEVMNFFKEKAGI